MLSKTFNVGNSKVTIRTRLVPKEYMRSSFSKWWPGDVFISVIIDKKLYQDIGYIRHTIFDNRVYNKGSFYYLEFDFDDCPISPYSTYTKSSKHFYTMDQLFEQACNYVYKQLEVEN